MKAAARRVAVALAMAGRRVGEAALLAGLASVGVTNPSIAAAVDLAAGVDDPDVRPLLDLALHSMFPADRRWTPTTASRYLAQLAALRDAVDARIASLGSRPGPRPRSRPGPRSCSHACGPVAATRPLTVRRPFTGGRGVPSGARG